MRYYVKNERGEELVVPSLSDLAGLYNQGFVDDEDYVRAETSDRWVKAGRMPALAGIRHRQREPGRFQLLLLTAILGVAIAVGALKRASLFLLLVLIAGVALISIYALTRRRR